MTGGDDHLGVWVQRTPHDCKMKAGRLGLLRREETVPATGTRRHKVSPRTAHIQLWNLALEGNITGIGISLLTGVILLFSVKVFVIGFLKIKQANKDMFLEEPVSTTWGSLCPMGCHSRSIQRLIR